MATTFDPPNMIERAALAAGQAHAESAPNLHPGGLNSLMGDGSVRFVKEPIDDWPHDRLTGTPLGRRARPKAWWAKLRRGGVWQALGSRNGGEIVEAGSY